MQQSQPGNADWRTSTFCAGNNCIEVARIGESIAIRDSKNPDGTIQMYSPSEWNAFLDGLARGDFDFPA
jgi:hypothetical protein